MKTLSQMMPVALDAVGTKYKLIGSKFIKDEQSGDYKLIEFETGTNFKGYIVIVGGYYGTFKNGSVILTIDQESVRWGHKCYDSFGMLLALSDNDIKIAVDNILKATIKDFSSMIEKNVNDSIANVMEELENVLTNLIDKIKKYSKIIQTPEMQAKFITRIVEVITKKTNEIVVGSKTSEGIFSFLKKG